MRIAALLLLSALLGCSGSKMTDNKPAGKMMDNQTAEDKVKSYLKTDHEILFTTVGRVGTNCGTIKTADGHEISLAVIPASDTTMLVFKAAEYLTVTPDGAGFWKIALTQKGQAATIGDPSGHMGQKGCDYQIMYFVVATPELVRIIGVTADENTPEVEYLWKWNVTELGRALRADGKAYAALSPHDRESLEQYKIIGGPHLPIPVPPENDWAKSDVMKFKRYMDGWRRVNN